MFFILFSLRKINWSLFFISIWSLFWKIWCNQVLSD